MAAQANVTTYTCGIDIGVKNLAISFVPTLSGKSIISYKGPIECLLRFEEDEDIKEFRMNGKSASHHECYTMLLEVIPEFKDTISTVIELQLAMNKSDMSRLDGVAYGFLKGRYPNMTVNLNASTIRNKFITDSIGSADTSEISLPRGYPTSKTQSFLFVGHKFPMHYAYIQQISEIDKIDDICDSVVYACLALVKYNVDKSTRSRRR